jgi:hypothetical protein
VVWVDLGCFRLEDRPRAGLEGVDAIPPPPGGWGFR